MAEENKRQDLKDNPKSQVKSDQTTMPSTGPGIGGTGSENPSAISEDLKKRNEGKKDLRSPEDRTKTAGTTGSQPKVTEGKFEEDENNTLLRKDEDEDGKVTLISTISEEEFNKNKASQAKAPFAVNETMRLEGVPGNVNLTADGMLQGDKSLRPEATLEEQNEEKEMIAGPNPIPNRDGNEITRAANSLSAGGPSLLFQIDQTTNKMSQTLARIREKGSLDENDKRELEQMEKDLRATGRM